ncbi:rifin PIR protein, putative [Plasmodium reichenowi]|uniref:Rifin PIR protein, putative n=1 Tax=Plasmodium reichenowi TaxID=5854 RepID=A0A2P9DKU6_PLARE|nr:rifin PIR protein, putative [Plasmodium reichenowi]
MKVHCINILLFVLPLNIMVHNKNKSYTTLHTQTNRSLCECELYEPANYDNDPQVKSVMENFNKQTQQRFHEYDERMKTTRQKCKEHCDKEIQKIILKDKLEKELMDKFATLQTDIKNDAIPTCICEKSLANKMEKTCLKYTQNVAGIVAPSSGVLAGIAEGALYAWKPLAIKAAKAEALAEATAAATQAGFDTVVAQLNQFLSNFNQGEGLVNLIPIVNKSNFKCGSVLFQNAKDLVSKSCIIDPKQQRMSSFCSTIHNSGETPFNGYAKAGAEVYEKTLESETATLTGKKVGAVDALSSSFQNAITASIIAIVVIILVMIIIYLILRYRRKKKMKKKLQYIKLLEE